MWAIELIHYYQDKKNREKVKENFHKELRLRIKLCWVNLDYKLSSRNTNNKKKNNNK